MYDPNLAHPRGKSGVDDDDKPFVGYVNPHAFVSEQVAESSLVSMPKSIDDILGVKIPESVPAEDQLSTDGEDLSDGGPGVSDGEVSWHDQSDEEEGMAAPWD